MNNLVAMCDTRKRRRLTSMKNLARAVKEGSLNDERLFVRDAI